MSETNVAARETSPLGRVAPSPPWDASSFLLAGGRFATEVVEISDDAAVLDRDGFWAVVVDFKGAVRCIRFADVRPAPPGGVAALRRGPWLGPSRAAWATTMNRAAYLDGVAAIRERIAAGEVYQVNLCRLLSAPLSAPAAEGAGGPGVGAAGVDLGALAAVVAAGNPAPYAVVLDVPEAGVRIVGASPELFLSRQGDVVSSRPIKGTGRTAADLREKDVAENIMIVDLVRNDLGRVAHPGSVTVPSLCAVEKHPGLVHLVSTVRARLRPGVGWRDLLAATCPPGSVSGAPKSSALRIIRELEPASRGYYCGGIGWVDADRNVGWLSVGIRTFWIEDDRIWFGTGAGITWGSDPDSEWRETELKADRLVGLASRSDDKPGTGGGPRTKGPAWRR
ncbi:anthranilate synthase component I family protein [Frankia sp. B2]|nr:MULTISPECIES: chorismate-binding protein [Frankia]ETA02081.1 anthranilate/para-aminobenzoate synthase component I [Frankia sp. CcI6]KDA43963.1 anthranilate/para-aminobenzoate synthase component I [Frankia sp. BMG5.23]TFE34789.1 anthranilate synthase component I family protein [Frankia sp. B2]